MKKFKFYFCSFIYIFLLTNVILAQTSSYIIKVSSAKLSLTQSQVSMLKRVQNDSVYKSFQWITLGNITDAQDSTGLLYITIPGRSGIIKVAPKNIQADSSTTYEWYGKVTNNDSTGDVYISCKAGKTTASIELLGEDYEIYSTDNNLHLLVQYDTARLNKYNRCGNDSTTVNSVSQKKADVTTNLQISCNDYARILVLYTPAAKQAVADINQTINLCISHFNTTITNSGIISAAHIQLVGSQQFNFTGTSFVSNDAVTLSNDPNAQVARDNAHADLVVLLTNSTMYTAYGAGAAYGPNSSRAYAICQIAVATSNRETFTHEVGHLYGCHHDYAVDPTGTPYAHGYSFLANNKTYYTVMVDGSHIGTSDYRLLNLSNPNVYVLGQLSGTTTHENNAREVSETYNTIVNFRTSALPPLNVSVDGPTSGCCYKRVTFNAVYGCGTAPYTFEWHESSDGINYNSTSGTGESFTATIPCLSGNYYYVKVIVHSNDGQTASAYLNVLIDHSCFGGKISNNTTFKKPLFNAEIQTSALKIQPNPVSQIANISFSLAKTSHVKLDILNASGRLIKTIINTTLISGSYNNVFNAVNLVKGIYICKLSINNSVQTKFIIIQ